MKLTEMDMRRIITRVLREDNKKKTKTQTQIIPLSIDIPWNKKIGKIKENITLSMSPTSMGLFDLGKDIEKYSGLKQSEAEEYSETPTDAYIYGLVNTMNDGKDIFFWTNGTRLAGAAKEVGIWSAILEQISHEGLHLTRAILAKHIMGDGFPTEDWPSIGDNEKENLIDEEALTTATGKVVEQITTPFLKMAEKYIPELTQKVRTLK